MLDSTVVVAVRTLPSRSTIVNWLVPCSTVLAIPIGTGPRVPAAAVPMLRSKLIRAGAALQIRLVEHVSQVPPGNGTKSVSATYLSRSA